MRKKQTGHVAMEKQKKKKKKKFVSRGVTAHNRWSKSLLSQYCSGKGFKALCHESHAQNLIGNRQSLQKKKNQQKNPCSWRSPQTLVLISMPNQLLELHGLLFPHTEDNRSSWASEVCSCPWYWSVSPTPLPQAHEGLRFNFMFVERRFAISIL